MRAAGAGPRVPGRGAPVEGARVARPSFGGASFAAELATLVLLTGACAPSERPPRSGGETTHRPLPVDERLFGPYRSMDSWFLMFLPLATYDENGDVVGRLARSWGA